MKYASEFQRCPFHVRLVNNNTGDVTAKQPPGDKFCRCEWVRARNYRTFAINGRLFFRSSLRGGNHFEEDIDG